MKDAIALLRLDDLFIESFEIKDVKVGSTLKQTLREITDCRHCMASTCLVVLEDWLER